MKEPFPRKKFIAVLNRDAGTVLQLGPETLASELKKLLEQNGCEAEVHCVPGDEMEQSLRDALQSGADGVLVGGGDGTASAAAEIFSGHAMPLGILPLGTFNLTARDVGMPLEWQEAVLEIIGATVSEMDLLEIDKRLCMCMVVLGFYPSLMMGQPEYHGSHLVKSLQTLWKAVWSMATIPPVDLHINDGGEVRSYRTRLVMIANNDYEDVFGLIPKRCSLNGGYFTVYIAKNHSVLGVVKTCILWLLGRWKRASEITQFPATDIEIDARRKRRMSVMIDGELMKIELPFKVKILPGALRVFSAAGGEEK